ncbi:O-antigen ligase family protein [Candidatus Shapirobacteria bacterium]|nr:O-antigen ligase family protein [Candidatus Shapirobacteria bacterium]
MAFISTLLTLALTFAFFFGQLGKIDIYRYSLSYLDIILPIIFIYNLLHLGLRKQLQIKNRNFLIFLIIAWSIFLVQLIITPFHLLSFMYLMRLTILLSFFIFPPQFINFKIFSLGIISNLIFGFIQYIIWPDFTVFKSFNWDPHLYRLVSTYFDPTFTALIYLLFIIFLFFKSKLRITDYGLLITSYLALSLTYSRSTFLSLAIVAFVVGKYLKKPSLGPLVTVLVIATVLLLPRFPGEGTKLERDSSIRAKIVNYQEGFSLFTKHPMFGVGYNNLPFVRTYVNSSSHAISGFDSSLLTILTTTGILGIVPFILGIIELYKNSSNIRKFSLLAVLVHSLFANSLLYPWILIFLALI